MSAALMIGHHLSIPALWWAPSATGAWRSLGTISMPSAASLSRVGGSHVHLQFLFMGLSSFMISRNAPH